MINMAPLPGLREMITAVRSEPISIEQGIKDEIWSRENQVSFYFSRSCNSLKAVIDYYKLMLNRKVNILVPEYICEEVLLKIYDDANVVFYKQDNGLKIDDSFLLDVLDSNLTVDCALLVHYFGIENNDIQLINYCKLRNVKIIEDCAHVLIPTGEIGLRGAFSLYSPHKHLPMPDGAVLVANSLSTGERSIMLQVYKSLTSNDDKCSSRGIEKWLFKKLIQGCIPQFMGKYLTVQNAPVRTLVNCNSNEKFSISKYSYAQLHQYSIAKLLHIGDIRKENYRCLKEYFTRRMKASVAIKPKADDIPYVLYLKFSNKDEARIFIEKVNSKGIFASLWPTLPKCIAETSNAYIIKENCVQVTIHHQINCKYLMVL